MQNVTVLGAGAAGLAVAAQLKTRGVESVVLERGPGVATSWRGRYDRLRLHTTRRLSGLPGLPIPRAYGRWVRRDDLVRYLEAYAGKFDLDVRTGTTVQRIVPVDGGWSLKLEGGGEHTTEKLVVATGYLHTPAVPEWPGREQWTGTLVHSAQYRNAEPFRGQNVLVVGVGNSGAEIATDLAEGGAASVSIAIRTPPHIVRRTVAGWPAQLNGLLLGRLPARVFDPMAATMARLEVPDLRPYGINRPTVGLGTRLRTSRYVPLQDVGIVRDVLARRVRPVAAVQSFTGTAVQLADGSSIEPDALVAATGYGSGLRDLFKDPSLFDPTGVPHVHGGPAARPGLYFTGYDVNLGGMLRQAGIDGRAVARTIAAR
ncbi:NAD(P)/FAD-dependent oxidoreductase [Actinoplanes sp. TRM 88003]|uniref:NAD(P)/FAD-dependent oxidoreductase n=1 Tax=Paractinoplanes aksuensis TaxID=2939490 RepID=A0ABT1DHB3_9ACTN|nr:NAD(P)-binding domain-containing protein [Actinoplanes aksuensis]MCO8270233.1 NAD(P)/FAD-dependent oxidoreductase [Actinoplanes aksuensis]